MWDLVGCRDRDLAVDDLLDMRLVIAKRAVRHSLDGDGEVLWCRGYDSAPNLWYSRGPSRIEKTQDDNYVVLANLGVQGYNRFYRPLLMKVDQNGDTLWTRSAGDPDCAYQTIDLLSYSDGGFIYDGVADGDAVPFGSGPFIFKTDSPGHLPCYERFYPITISDLFPTDSSFTLTSNMIIAPDDFSPFKRGGEHFLKKQANKFGNAIDFQEKSIYFS